MTNLSIRGFLVGHIWMPHSECWKELSYDITKEDKRFSNPGTLRAHILRATNDGDFQSCVIAAGELIATRTTVSDGRRVTVERSWPLDRFPSIRDCLHADPDWCPSFPMTRRT